MFNPMLTQPDEAAAKGSFDDGYREAMAAVLELFNVIGDEDAVTQLLAEFKGDPRFDEAYKQAGFSPDDLYDYDDEDEPYLLADEDFDEMSHD